MERIKKSFRFRAGQEEKEIIAIVASAERRNAILEAINKNHGLRSDAHGMICSVPLDKVARIG